MYIVALLSLLFAVNLSANTGEEIFNSSCLSCHGEASSGLPAPKILGQKKAYLLGELKKFKSGARQDLMMNAMPALLANLSDQELNDVAEYVSQLDECNARVPIDPMTGDIILGEALVKKMNCIGCHNPALPASNAPNLLGQKTSYLDFSLKAFRDKTRKGTVMPMFSSKLTDLDTVNIAAYYNNKQNCQ